MKRYLSVASHAFTALAVLGLASLAFAQGAQLFTIVGATGNGALVNSSGALEVDATITPSGTQNVNLTQVGSAAVALGQAAMAASIPVVVASNQSALSVAGTGAAGTANAGVVTVQGIASMTPILSTPTGNVTAADDAALTNTQKVYALGGVYDGATIDMQRSITAAVAAGTGNQAVTPAPTSASAAAVAYDASTAAGTNNVICAAACNLFAAYVTSTPTVAGYVMIFNATALPSNGAVTPVFCFYVPSNATVAFEPPVPIRFATGVTIGFSSDTDGCLDLTAANASVLTGVGL